MIVFRRLFTIPKKVHVVDHHEQVSSLLIAVLSIGFLAALYLFPIYPIPFLKPDCSSVSLDSIVEKSRIPVMIPAYLPEGYAYRAGQLIPKFNQPVESEEHFEIRYAPTNLPCAETDFSKGVIIIQGYNFTEAINANMTSSQYIDSKYNYSRSLYGEGVKRFALGDGRNAYGAPVNTWGNSLTYLVIAEKFPIISSRGFVFDSYLGSSLSNG